MFSQCCNAPVDYVYATWFACRLCGQWTERQPQLMPGGGVITIEQLPMHFEVHPHRGHAMGSMYSEPEPIIPLQGPA